ncbi:hypothetical protein VIGAN_01461300 [Vigna angularis var. angularis]|uniref:Uncharacterized protein n=1 Tax=Vigna angularis var. angularis TaxID=157739 RepID=A0A0S3R7P8_PHAAN|nr:hypothetical protein VIGAN_01461300 [Vigna angularis var. angularis]
MMGFAGDALDRVATAPAASCITGATLTHGPRGGDWVRREWLGCAAEGECVFLSREGEGAKWWWSAVKGDGYFGASTGNTVDSGVVAGAATSMRWRSVSPTAPPIGFERSHVLVT